MTLHKCPDGTANDFAKLTTIGGVTINEDTTTPYLYAIDDNDFNNGDGPEDFSFAFPVKNTVICEPLVDKEYYVKINGTEVDIATVNWAYFQDTDLTDVRFTIDSTESDETGTQTITIGSRITNVVDANGPLESDDEITFAVIMYAS